MIAATVLAVFIVPVLYVIVNRIATRRGVSSDASREPVHAGGVE
jgi:hypothetical protein